MKTNDTPRHLTTLAAGGVALVGGLAALLNPASFGVAVTTLAGWALLIVAALQAWACWRAEATGARLGAGAMAAGALFLACSLLFGPFGEGWLWELLLGALLLLSGVTKLWVGHKEMRGARNLSLMWGTGGLSALLGLLLLFGLKPEVGVVLGLELLASGLALVVLALHRRG